MRLHPAQQEEQHSGMNEHCKRIAVEKRHGLSAWPRASLQGALFCTAAALGFV